MEHYFDKIHGWFTFPNFYTEVVKQAKDGYHFVEVGAWKGMSTVFLGVEIVNSGKKIKLDAVDTWEGSEEHTSQESPFYEPLLEIENGLYEHFLDNIEPLKNVITPIKKTSIEAAKGYEDGSLDFVFIDAAHDYDNVCADIKAWLPKIKSGRLLGGHDFSHEPIQKALTDTLGPGFQPADEDIWIYKVKK